MELIEQEEASSVIEAEKKKVIERIKKKSEDNEKSSSSTTMSVSWGGGGNLVKERGGMLANALNWDDLLKNANRSTKKKQKKIINPADRNIGDAIKKDESEIAAPSTAKFNQLVDQSYSLEIQPGQRLKLDLRGLTQEGKRALQREKKQKNGEPVEDFWESMFDDGSIDWMNEYTITMDIKLNTVLKCLFRVTEQQLFTSFMNIQTKLVDLKEAQLIILL